MNRHKHSRFLSPFPVVFFDADDGANGAGGSSASGDQDQNGNQSGNAQGGNANNGNQSHNSQQSQNQQSGQQPDFKAIATAVVAEVLAANSVNGDQAKALEVLAGRNARLEADRDAKVQEIGRLKAQLPDSKQAQSDADELAAWRKLSESGVKKPEDVNALIAERDGLKATEQKHQHEKTVADAADVLGLKNNALLQSLLSKVDLVIEGEKTADEDKRVVKVKTKTEQNGTVEEKITPFEEYAKTQPELTDALPALRKDAQNTQGARHVQQGSGGTKVTAPDPTDTYLNKKYQRPDQSDKK